MKDEPCPFCKGVDPGPADGIPLAILRDESHPNSIFHSRYVCAACCGAKTRSAATARILAGDYTPGEPDFNIFPERG